MHVLENPGYSFIYFLYFGSLLFFLIFINKKTLAGRKGTNHHKSSREEVAICEGLGLQQVHRLVVLTWTNRKHKHLLQPTPLPFHQTTPTPPHPATPLIASNHTHLITHGAIPTVSHHATPTSSHHATPISTSPHTPPNAHHLTPLPRTHPSNHTH